jgi:hypothetical protein
LLRGRGSSQRGPLRPLRAAAGPRRAQPTPATAALRPPRRPCPGPASRQPDPPPRPRRARLDLQLHHVAARGRADEAGAHIGVVLVEAAHVARPLVVVDHVLVIRARRRGGRRAGGGRAAQRAADRRRSSGAGACRAARAAAARRGRRHSSQLRQRAGSGGAQHRAGERGGGTGRGGARGGPGGPGWREGGVGGGVGQRVCWAGASQSSARRRGGRGALSVGQRPPHTPRRTPCPQSRPRARPRAIAPPPSDPPAPVACALHAPCCARRCPVPPDRARRPPPPGRPFQWHRSIGGKPLAGLTAAVSRCAAITAPKSGPRGPRGRPIAARRREGAGLARGAPAGGRRGGRGARRGGGALAVGAARRCGRARLLVAAGGSPGPVRQHRADPRPSILVCRTRAVVRSSHDAREALHRGARADGRGGRRGRGMQPGEKPIPCRGALRPPTPRRPSDPRRPARGPRT